MKIITEPVKDEPAHSVTKRDVQMVLKNVPEEWSWHGSVFLIAAQKFENSKWDRPVILNQGTLRILSRGFDRNQIIKELLIELAIRPTGLYPRYAHRLDKEKRRKLELVVHPYYEKVLADLAADVN